MAKPHPLHPVLLPLLALLALPACESGDPAGISPDDALLTAPAAVAMRSAAGSADVRQGLAALRRMTAPFHDMAAAEAAGWDVPLTPCMSSPDGGMGVHMANMDLLLDGKAELLGPETLLYEPQKNGRMRLVAVEYLVPFSLLPSDADAPELLGEHFHQNFEAGVWALHVWIWRHNPAGMFADWNENVTCDWAS